MELTLKGNMRAKFSPASNKLISAEITFDTGNVAAQLQLLDAPKTEPELNDCEMDNFHVAAEAAAAQAAANEADALLDSLQMPQLGAAVPAAITVGPTASSSEGCIANAVSDKDDSSDEGVEDSGVIEAGGPSRRNIRRKE